MFTLKAGNSCVCEFELSLVLSSMLFLQQRRSTRLVGSCEFTWWQNHPEFFTHSAQMEHAMLNSIST